MTGAERLGAKSGQGIPELSKADLDRFWYKFTMGDGCWEWTASGCGQGYGGFHIGPRKGGKTYLAHRVSYSVFVGDIPPEMTISHLCHNRRCVRPKHLVAEPIQKNLARSIAGEGHRDAKLTEKQVIAMRKRHRESGITCKQLAEEYGVAESTANHAVTGRTWKHVREGL